MVGCVKRRQKFLKHLSNALLPNVEMLLHSLASEIVQEGLNHYKQIERSVVTIRFFLLSSSANKVAFQSKGDNPRTGYADMLSLQGLNKRVNEWNEIKWKSVDFKCVRKPTKSRLSLTHHVNKSNK